MHGATLSTADASLLPKQLCHDVLRRYILAQGVHVIPVCGADVVVLQAKNQHCLIPDVLVTTLSSKDMYDFVKLSSNLQLRSEGEGFADQG